MPWGPPRQDAVSGTPLLQEEEEVAREEGLSTAGPQQAVQVPEGESDGQVWGPCTQPP